VVDFRNTVLIMTSNLGTEFVSRGGTLGFLGAGDDQDKESHQKIEKALKSTFRPEFLNRIDEVIIFSPLSIEQMMDIVILQMKEIDERLKDHGIKIELTPEAQKWLAEAGFDPLFGARPLKRALQKHVESPLSVKLLENEFNEGDTVIADLQDGQITFRKKEAEQPAS